MRIAYFTESLPPLTDGVAMTLANLKETLDSENCEFLFFSPFLPDPDGWGGRVKRISSLAFPLYPDYKVALPALHDIKNVLEDFDPDIIHICSPTFLGLTGLKYAKKNNIPAVASYHTSFVSYFKYYGIQILASHTWNYLRWFYNNTQAVFVPSKTTIDELTGKGFNNLRQWGRGIDIEKFSTRFSDNRLRKRWSPECWPIILFVGRLVKEKDIDILIKSYWYLKERNAKFKMVFVGDGRMRDEISRTIPDAILTGFLEGAELSRAYASADIFAFPSTTETYGNVIVEAAASGLPAVVVSEGGVKDLIMDGQTGFIARPFDFVDFASKLEIILIDDNRRRMMSANAINFAATKSWREINRNLLHDYDTVINSHNENSTGSNRLKSFFKAESIDEKIQLM